MFDDRDFDRAGEKPLFYARIGDELWFASEMQALLLHPGLDRVRPELTVSRSLRGSARPRRLFAGIRRVPACDAAGVRYWNPRELSQRTHVATPTAEIASSMLRCGASSRPTRRSVFLSGGLDSSLIAMIAA